MHAIIWILEFMNFVLFLIKFIKFKQRIKFKKFELHNYAADHTQLTEPGTRPHTDAWYCRRDHIALTVPCSKPADAEMKWSEMAVQPLSSDVRQASWTLDVGHSTDIWNKSIGIQRHIL